MNEGEGRMYVLPRSQAQLERQGEAGSDVGQSLAARFMNVCLVRNHAAIQRSRSSREVSTVVIARKLPIRQRT